LRTRKFWVRSAKNSKLVVYPSWINSKYDSRAPWPRIYVNTRELRESSFLRTEHKPNQLLGLEPGVRIGKPALHKVEGAKVVTRQILTNWSQG
jgi:hypothetical protein